MSEIPKCCGTKKGGRVVKLSCNVRFESDLFYDISAENISSSSSANPPLASSDPPLDSSDQGNSSNSSKTIVVIVVPIVVFILLVIIIFTYFKVKKGQEGIKKMEVEGDDEIKPIETLHFDFETIRIATDDFTEANRLGQGGFGPVYKGMLYDGQEVAVKRLSIGSAQGDVQFKTEIMLVAKLQHRNLVRLLGFCLEGDERLLIYEFLPNKSLDYFLFDPNRQMLLNWETRHKIIVGIARGLLYLHEDSRLRIIHRDLKPSNILLDEELDAKIADFGMARLFDIDQSESNTSKIVGTYGYMAPEYASLGQFSVKSDVYSFGVIVLEIISGKKINSTFPGQNSQYLLSFVWKNWIEGTASNIIDPILSDGSINEIMRCIHIGLLCVQENVDDRPTMSSVLLMLSTTSLTLQLPSQPPFYINTIRSNSSEQENSHVEASENEASITELFPR